MGQLRERYVKAAQQSSSGKRIEAPSDDPIAAAEDVRVQASLAQNEAFRNTINIARGDVQTSEAALDAAGQVLQRAIELAMSGASGATGTNQYQALADEVTQLADEMVTIANTKGSQGYLFSGTTTDMTPFDSNGTYSGNDDERLISIDGGTPVSVSVSGARAFANPNGRNVIQDLRDLAIAMSNQDSPAVHELLDGLNASHSQVVQERAASGLILDRLTLTDSFLEQTGVDLMSRSSALTDADPIDTLSTLAQLQTTIQQTVSVDQKLLQTTAITLGS
jgi:flagellar hook-associated protein 3 FlgL